MRASTLAVALSAIATTFVAAQTSHTSGGKEHIVLFDKNHPIPPAVEDVLARLELNTSHPDVKRIYNNSAFVGFSAEMLPHCLDLLANMSDVSMVEESVAVSKLRTIPAERRATPFHFDSRADAPWGLQSISTTSKTEGNPNVMDFTYRYANKDLGSGADIYLIDTGLYSEHMVFGGRAKQIWSFDGKDNITDGHGTHVAGTAGGETLGVASKANIYGLQALRGDGDGWSSNIVAAIDRAVQAHDARKAQASTNGHRGSVMSMSLAAGGAVGPIDQAIDAAIKAGMHVVVAAGNSAEDACSYSPSMSGGTHGPAITVGSVRITGDRSAFSNYGKCVDVYAPGEDIVSAWIGAPNMVNVESGTSMATPHVTGIVAYAMANQTLADSPALMKEWIVMQGTPRADGTVLANNGVRSESSTSTSTSAKQAASGWQKSKRGVGEGFSTVVAWLTKSFGKKHHRRFEVADTDKTTFRFEIDSLDTSIKARAVGDGLNNLVGWLTHLFHGKKHHKRSDIEERGIGEGFNSLISWLMNLFHGKKHHKRSDIEERGIGEGFNSLISWLTNLFSGKKHHHRRADTEPEGFKAFWNWIKSGFKSLLNGHKHSRRDVEKEGFKSFWNWIKSSFKSLFNGHKHSRRDVEKEGFKAFWNWIKSGITSLFHGHKHSRRSVEMNEDADEFLEHTDLIFDAIHPRVQHRRLIQRPRDNTVPSIEGWEL